MIYADNICEPVNITIRNLSLKATQSEGTWFSGTGYGFYPATLEKPLYLNHYYYIRYTYKFTTTNQSPTWVCFYYYGGMMGTSARIDSPVAGTEYTASTIFTPSYMADCNPYAMTIYNGSSNAISGVTSYVKNVIIYDVTDLFHVLRSRGSVANSTSALKTWCDSNLAYKPCNTNYTVSVASSSNKISLTDGIVVANIVETDGMRQFSANDSLKNDPWFDNGNPITIYNNAGNGTVTHTRVAASTQASPWASEHPYILKITTNGTASPGAGGFVAYHNSAANKVFVERFVAKIPVGYNVSQHYNSQGDSPNIYWITPTAGTGDWEEYAVVYECGSSGTFSSGGHIALKGSNNTSVTWYLAYINNCDITSDPSLKNYTVLPGKSSIKGNKLFSHEFNTVNILTNGDFHNRDTSSLPSGCSYDTTDFAGNSTCSLVQPVGKGAIYLPYMIPIDPMTQYKLSYWVKCKGDMTSFLTAILFYTADKQGPWGCSSVCYKSGTKTTLTAALQSGATQMTVASNSNWSSYSYSRLGFRSSIYGVSYNNRGTSHGYNSATGIVKGVSGSTIVTFNTAYSGDTIPANTCVVESFDGGTYPYPIAKYNLPTDNTWKYCEGYFGVQDNLWDGKGSSSWDGGIPSDMKYMQLQLNLYTNDGTVPIKWSDIRITPVNSANGRVDKKVSIR